MDVLVVHTSYSNKDRKTITDSLYCFRRYTTGHRVFFLDVQTPEDVDARLAQHPFDAVIFHYSFMAKRNSPPHWQAFYSAAKERLHSLSGIKVMIPQDEYNFTQSLRDFAREVGVAHIFTCAAPIDYGMLYPPEQTGGAAYSTVYTGYIDQRSLKTIRRLARRAGERDIDIGYRARKLPYWLGRHGQLKTELADRFNSRLPSWPGIHADIQTTGSQDGGVLLGNSWLEFMLRCRTMLGCLGGSGLMDADGSIYARVEAYCAKHPEAGFEEVEAACFAGQDGKLHLYALSPRHFECAMTQTCQVLVEGDYQGVFRPGEHYIEIKYDFSNIDDVLAQIEDKALCEKMAQKCYDDVVGEAGPDNPNTYAWYANHVLETIKAVGTHKTPRAGAGKALALRFHLEVAKPLKLRWARWFEKAKLQFYRFTGRLLKAIRR